MNNRTRWKHYSEQGAKKIKSRSTPSVLLHVLSVHALDYRHTDKHLRLVMTGEGTQIDRQKKMDRQMDGRMLPSALFPNFAKLHGQ